MSIKVVANANKWRWWVATMPPGCRVAGQVQSHALKRQTPTPHKTIRPELSRILDIPGFPRTILCRLSPAMGHSELHAGFEGPMVGSTPGDAYLDKLSRFRNVPAPVSSGSLLRYITSQEQDWRAFVRSQWPVHRSNIRSARLLPRSSTGGTPLLPMGSFWPRIF
jgi:hypothetical protein